MTTAIAMPSIHQHRHPSAPLALAPAPASAPAPAPKIQHLSPGKGNPATDKPTSCSEPDSALRARRERPCDGCRRRKSRCVIQEGTALCVLCGFHKQECTFVQSPLPRKRKLVDSDNKSSLNHIKKRSVDSKHPSLALSTPNISIITPIPPPEQPQWPRSAVSPLPQRNATLGLQPSQHSRHLGFSCPFDPLLIGLSHFNHRNESPLDLGTLRRVNHHECFIMFPDENTQDYANEADALNRIEQLVHPHGPALLDLYFQVVHPSYPIIQKHLLVKRHPNRDSSFSPALLAAMYILALAWWSRSPELAKHAKPDVARLEAIAFKALTASMERPKLSTVQAGLLLLQRPEADSWSLTTQLVAVGQELGLHLDCSSWSIPLWERGLRKRIAWALYMQDKWTSLIHGRPSHIFLANWAVKPILGHDFDERGDEHDVPPQATEEHEENHRGWILFAQLIGLTQIMAEILDTFYTQTAIHEFANAGGKSTELILVRAKPVQIKLRQWHENLPEEVKMQAPGKSKFPSTGYLHLAYFATEITLHRRIVQSLDATNPNSYGLFMCRNAAKTRLISAMDFVNRLTPEHLESFWYFASKVNFALIGTFGSLLWATSPAREEADFYKIRLREYRWTLSVSSTRAAFLDYALSMLDASRAMLDNLAEKPSLAGRIDNAGVLPSRRHPLPLPKMRSSQPPPPPSSSSSLLLLPDDRSGKCDQQDTKMYDFHDLDEELSSGESVEDSKLGSQASSQTASIPPTAANSP